MHTFLKGSGTMLLQKLFSNIKASPKFCLHPKIRAANLSGDCWFSKEAFGRFRFRWRAHQQVKCNMKLGLLFDIMVKLGLLFDI